MLFHWQNRTVIHMASLLPNRTVHCLLLPKVSLVLNTGSGWDLHHWNLAVLYRRAITQSIKGKNTPPEKNSHHPPSGEAATGSSIIYLTGNRGNSIAVMPSTASYKGAVTEGSPRDGNHRGYPACATPHLSDIFLRWVGSAFRGGETESTKVRSFNHLPYQCSSPKFSFFTVWK